MTLRAIMGDLDYPVSGGVLDRETLLRLTDLEQEVQTFRGLNHLRAREINLSLPATELSKETQGQLWQIVYFALRLFDHAYPTQTKPHTNGLGRWCAGQIYLMRPYYCKTRWKRAMQKPLPKQPRRYLMC